MSSIRLILAGGARQELRHAARLAQEAGAQVRLAEDGAEALLFARRHGADLLLADVSRNDVPALVAALRAERIALPVLACGVDAPAPLAVAAVRSGAIDYLPLPPSRELIAAALLSIGNRADQLIGEDREWRRVVDHVSRFAASAAPILITGPAGSGKQALGRHLHRLSGRSGPLVLLDCLGDSEEEVQRSELLGHRRDAFDGAVADRAGKLGEAAGGTLLVRRAEALAPSLQQALAQAAPRVDVRLIVTAASRTLLQPELFKLLSLVEAPVPSLAGRHRDILPLAEAFVRQLAAAQGLAAPILAPCAVRALEAHPWPGNVSELEEVIHRALALAGAGPIRAADLVLADGRMLGAPHLPIGELVGRTMEEVERALILGTLQRCNGNRTSASAILGISVRTMRNKLRLLKGEGVDIAPAA